MKAGGKRVSHLSCAPDYSQLSKLVLFQVLLFEAHLLSVIEAAPPAGEHVGRGDNGRAHRSSREAIKIAVVLSKVRLSKSNL